MLVALGVLVGVLGAWWIWQRSSFQHEESSGPLRVFPTKIRVDGNPDDFVTLVFMLHNLSDQEHSYELRAEVPPGWQLLEALRAIAVSPQAQHEVFFTVQIPPGTPPGRYTLGLYAASGVDFAVGRAQVIVRARERLKLSLASADLLVRPSEEKSITLTVTNRGNIPARATVAVATAPLGWQFQLQESALTLAPRESKTVELRVKPLPGVELAPGRFTVQAISPSARDELSVTVVLVP
ncbi:MAG: NEW3 domain-containing protein [Candidatus Bipolaricaulota bacterium]|nr:NEW3 domain-containing protein [Candidatus Bipolaricaulota bacterium]MDW8031163.1 NEW3 domain-containing protein [Candidatus Bipolaricaulota bacterium]